MDTTTDTEWEKLCRRCGLCCFEKIDTGRGTVFYTSTPCRYLDVISRECTIYERRFEIYPECIKLTPELVEKLFWLHPDCGYRQEGKGRHPERVNSGRKRRRPRSRQ